MLVVAGSTPVSRSILGRPSGRPFLPLRNKQRSLHRIRPAMREIGGSASLRFAIYKASALPFRFNSEE